MSLRRVVAWTPCLLTGLYGLLLVVPPTRHFAFELQRESGALEQATFVLLMVAALLTASAAFRIRSRPHRVLAAAVAILLFVVAGEEIAWGQHILGEPLVESWAEANQQNETTLHNLPGLQGKSELIYLFIALCALIARRPAISNLLGPLRVSSTLVPGLIVVVVYAIAEISVAFINVPKSLREAMSFMGEMVEFVTGYLAIVWAYGTRRNAMDPA